jgi:sterol desaturase/sphingolipid hydroxylase (fatty acid hydroxylase superfamily)
MAWIRFSSFWIYPLLTGLLFYLSGGQQPQAPQILGLIGIGLVLWSLLEYLLHRFFFHWTPHNRKMRQIIHQLHFHHHGDPSNRDKILVHPLYSLPVSALLGYCFYLATGSLFAAMDLISGIWAGFLYYEWVHYRLHLGKKSKGLLKHQRGWHFHHHFVDPHHCFGVTSPLWDVVFGTFKSTDR